MRDSLEAATAGDELRNARERNPGIVDHVHLIFSHRPFDNKL